MREIKFRAWDIKDKLMISNIETIYDSTYSDSIKRGLPKEYSLPDNFEYFLNKSNFIVMQYTGLKDKNKKEIYEGDIIRIEDSELKETILYPYIYKVVFNTPLFQLERKIPIGKINKNMVELPLEIIGNIYENPELLEVK